MRKKKKAPTKKPKLERMHESCRLNRHALSGSAQAGCFYCLCIWDPKEDEIREWIHDDREEGNATALCPFCGINAVLSSIAVGTISEELLRKMHNYWFVIKG